MSIICYTGLPGGGKSYSAVENVIIPALKAGRVVAHNLDLVESALSIVCAGDDQARKDLTGLLVQLGREDTPAELVAKCPPGCCIVIDEVWRYWPAGLKANEVPKDELKFFKEHRHRVGADGFATEILIIDQDPKTGVPSFLRSLIENTYIHTKQAAIGAKGRYRVDVYTGAQSSAKPTKGAHLRQMHGKYKPQVWNCYVSHTQSERPAEAGLELAVDSRANIWKSWRMRLSLGAMCLLPFALIGSVQAFYNIGASQRKAPAPVEQSETKPALSAVSAEPVAAKPSVAAPAAAPAAPAESRRWRLTGIEINARRQVAMLESGDATRLVDLRLCQRAIEWSCVVDGELVTMWTGPLPSAFAASTYQALTPGVTP
jgi:zona occludens toxin